MCFFVFVTATKNNVLVTYIILLLELSFILNPLQELHRSGLTPDTITFRNSVVVAFHGESARNNRVTANTENVIINHSNGTHVFSIARRILCQPNGTLTH